MSIKYGKKKKKNGSYNMYINKTYSFLRQYLLFYAIPFSCVGTAANNIVLSYRCNQATIMSGNFSCD